ncbi:MAG: sugar ABC transporter permease [Candidatus Symbiobacter sp.]|nr:sugar ABC transporter permease [Candidatus Symbiobacter sp.]
MPLKKITFRDPSDKTLAVFMLAPALILIAMIVAYPIGRLVWNSFYDLHLSGVNNSIFIGIAHYQKLWHDQDFWQAIWTTILFTIITVPGALVVGMGLALLANLPFKRRWPVRLALLLPWALPLSFTGLIFAWFFHTDYGIVNDWLVKLGFESQMFLLRPSTAFIAACIAIIWKTSSFMAMVLLAGLQVIPKSLYEAAEVDGASKWQQFCQITLPMLKPAIIVALIFRTITALQTFDIPYAMARNITVTLSMQIQKTTIDYLDVGYGSAMAVAMFVLSLAVSSLYLRRIAKPA